jgi:hypothetical protein
VVPQGSTAVKVTVILILLVELFMTTPVTLAHSPAKTVVGFTLMYSPVEDCALTGNGTKTSARQASAKKFLISFALIDLSP